MRGVVIHLTLECADDVPPHVLDWMSGNLAEHAENEFGGDYEPEWTDPQYDGPPLLGVASVTIDGVETDYVETRRRQWDAAMQLIEQVRPTPDRSRDA
jgi:hypothetical protein